MSLFSDISILCSDSIPSKTLMSGLSSVLRSSVMRTKIIQWETTSNLYKFSNGGTKILKTKSIGWDPPIHSQFPITTSTYFQARINTLYPAANENSSGGFHLGIANSNKTPEDSHFDPKHAICLFNSQYPDDAVVKRYGPCRASNGDIVGVVVDFIADKIIFYVNGKLAAVGVKPPSRMQPIYAVTWIYYGECEIEMGDFIKYTELEKHSFA